MRPPITPRAPPFCVPAPGQVRLNVLSTLLGEAHAHLHQHLCACVLGRKVFVMPFHRDVQVRARSGGQAGNSKLNLNLNDPPHTIQILDGVLYRGQGEREWP